MAKKADRILITLACTACRERTYHTEKNKRNDPERLVRNTPTPPQLPSTVWINKPTEVMSTQ